MAVTVVGPYYAGAATAGTDWTSLSNAVGPSDGNYAYDGNVGPGGGGNNSPSSLSTSSHGFTIPTGAVIVGIMLEAKVSSSFSFDQTIYIGNGSKISTSTPNFGQAWNGNWNIYGGSTALWGRTDWTAADINNAAFGATLCAFPSHSTDNIDVDAVRITVWWLPPVVTGSLSTPKKYLYKVYDPSNTYLGNLPTPYTDFGFSQDINTAGSQITVKCPVSMDTAYLPSGGTLTDESGGALTDESGSPLLSDGAVSIVGLGGSTALVRNGNKVVVWEYSNWNLNGRPMYSGTIKHWEGDFGGEDSDDDITILIYGDGVDLDNRLLLGPPFAYTADQSQLTDNSYISIYNTTGDKGGGYQWAGQTWTDGSGVNNLGAINFLLNGSANVTATFYPAPGSSIILGSTNVNVAVGGPTVIQFALPSEIDTAPGTSYFVGLTVDSGQSINVYYQNTNVYSGGSMYSAYFGGGTGGGSWGANTGADLYFETFSSSGVTSSTFTSMDPSTGMLAKVMSAYDAQGGLISTASGSIQATGLSLTAGFNTNTVLEGIQAFLSFAPDGFYWYVDLGTDILYFKQANSVADIVLTKGLHMDRVKIIATIESIVNSIFFTGGKPSGSSTNLYSSYQDTPSISQYGVSLDRPSNNRVVDQPTADAIGNSELAEKKNEQFQTTVTVLDKTMDIGALKVGMVAGFNGFGSFVDTQLLQIVRIQYAPEEATLTLGSLPVRQANNLEQTTRNLIAIDTVANPSSPS